MNDEKKKRRSAEEDLDERFSPEMPMDFVERTQTNTFTETVYTLYKLYDSSKVSKDGETSKKTPWTKKQVEEWGHHLNDDGTRKSEVFEGVPGDHKYVVALTETGEWKSFKTRREITMERGWDNPLAGAMYPYARWSKHEKARMEVYSSVKTMTLALSKALPENCENEVAYLTARDIREAALMLLSIEEERRAEAEFHNEMIDTRSEVDD